MQLLYIDADGRHLCLLNAAEVAQLQGTPADSPQPDLLLRQLAALPLDAATYNAIARATKAYPHLFLDQDGRRMTLQSWGQAVLAGRWTAPGLGEMRLRRVREVAAFG